MDIYIISIWGFPKMVVPPVIIHYVGKKSENQRLMLEISLRNWRSKLEDEKGFAPKAVQGPSPAVKIRWGFHQDDPAHCFQVEIEAKQLISSVQDRSTSFNYHCTPCNYHFSFKLTPGVSPSEAARKRHIMSASSGRRSREQHRSREKMSRGNHFKPGWIPVW